MSFVLPLNQFGIIPRTATGLIGVIGAPFLHGSWGHLISNTLALVTFVPIFIAVEGKDALEKILSLAVLTGLLTWGLARPANHIGASGVVFGLYGYLISLGFFNKKILQVALSLFLLSSYGYILFGIFPVQPGISWESHFFGLASGIVLAKYR